MHVAVISSVFNVSEWPMAMIVSAKMFYMATTRGRVWIMGEVVDVDFASVMPRLPKVPF